MGLPTIVVSSPSARAWAASDRPNGPAPMISRSVSGILPPAAGTGNQYLNLSYVKAPDGRAVLFTGAAKHVPHLCDWLPAQHLSHSPIPVPAHVVHPV